MIIKVETFEKRLAEQQKIVDSLSKDSKKVNDLSSKTLELASKSLDQNASMISWVSVMFNIFSIITGVVVFFLTVLGFKEIRNLKNLAIEMRTSKEALEKDVALLKKEHQDYIRIPALYVEGSNAFRNGKLTDSERKFKEILKLNPNNYDATCFLSECYSSQGQYNLALSNIETALKAENPSKAYSIQGVNFRRASNFEASIGAFIKAIELEDKAQFHTHLGYTYFNMGEFENAIKEFDKAVIKKEYSSPLCGKAKSLIKLNRDAEAKVHFKKAINRANEEILRDSDSPYPHYVLAFCRINKGEEADCIENLNSALELKRNHGIIAEQLNDLICLRGTTVSSEILEKCIEIVQGELDKFIAYGN